MLAAIRIKSFAVQTFQVWLQMFQVKQTLLPSSFVRQLVSGCGVGLFNNVRSVEWPLKFPRDALRCVGYEGDINGTRSFLKQSPIPLNCRHPIQGMTVGRMECNVN